MACNSYRVHSQFAIASSSFPAHRPSQQLVKLATGRDVAAGAKALRGDHCVEARTPVEQGTNSRGIFESQQLWQPANRAGSGGSSILRQTSARSHIERSSFLSGLPQAPTRFNPWRHPDQANRKYSRSLARLVELGVITRDQQSLLARPPKIAHTDPPRLAAHFVDAVVARNPGLRGTVRTTLDLYLQATAERLVRSHLSALNRHDITQAAVVVVENATGSIRAMVGSENYAVSQINGATQPRSCGSTLKPFVYLDAIDKRLLTAASLLPDTPDAIRGEYADYDPQNYNHHYRGPVRLREALGCSLNVPAVFALSRLGARPAFYQLQNGADFPTGLADYGAGFVLGNAERLVDLAAAYADWPEADCDA